MCTTLSSVGSEIFRRMKTKFSVTIIDEAAPCREPSTLIPLTEIKTHLLLGRRSGAVTGDSTFSRVRQEQLRSVFV